jgi:hypothetical protein
MQSASSPALVIIGHVGFATDRTASGSATYPGGSGLAVAFVAAALLDGVGLVAADPQTCRETCARADLIFLNKAEYRGLYDSQPQPPVPVIRKYGPGGAEFLAPDRQFRIPAPPADEVDPIGAGEILAGAFLALRARGSTEEQALTYSVAVAARSVTEFGVAGPAVAGELERVRAKLGSRRAAGAP